MSAIQHIAWVIGDAIMIMVVLTLTATVYAQHRRIQELERA